MSRRYPALFAALALHAAVSLCVPCTTLRAEPPAPPVQATSDGYEWLQMDNGEWLKGWITSMSEGTLVFESETFSELYPDWSSVVKLYTGLPHTYVLRDRTVFVGLAALEDGKLRLGTRTIDPKELFLIASGGQDEWTHWSFNFKSGLTLYLAASSQFTWNNSVSVTREDGITSSSLKYDGALGDVDGELTVSSHTGSLNIKILVTSRLYVLPFAGALRHDLQQNINLRTTLGAGAGVRLIDIAAGSWDMDLGPAYISTLPISTEEGPVLRDKDAGIILNTYAKFDLAKDLTVTASWLSAFAVTGPGRSYHSGTVAIDFELTSVFSVDFSLVFNRTEDATPTETGEVPAENELQLVVSLGVKL
jgi:Protein of unknown function, DUF481